MKSVDTNVLIRLVVRDNAQQAAAAEAFVGAGAWVSHLVLVEALWVMDSVYGLVRSQIAEAVEMFLAHQNLALQDPDTVWAALNEFKRRAKVDFSDCLILESARKAGHLPLGTFDKALAQAEGTRRL